jgi:hypothetical protein
LHAAGFQKGAGLFDIWYLKFNRWPSQIGVGRQTGPEDLQAIALGQLKLGKLGLQTLQG